MGKKQDRKTTRNRKADSDDSDDSDDSHVLVWRSSTNRSRVRDYTKGGSSSEEDDGSSEDSGNPFSSEDDEDDEDDGRTSRSEDSNASRSCRSCAVPIGTDGDYKRRLCKKCAREPLKETEVVKKTTSTLGEMIVSRRSEASEKATQPRASLGMTMTTTRSEKTTSRSSTKTSVITLVPKDGHPQEKRILGTDKCFAVDGEKGKVLILNRGSSYRFDVIQATNAQGGYDDFLFFTADCLGGPGDVCCAPGYTPERLPLSPAPIGAGTVRLTIQPNYPPVIYYQSTTHPGMGGMMFIRS